MGRPVANKSVMNGKNSPTSALRLLIWSLTWVHFIQNKTFPKPETTKKCKYTLCGSWVLLTGWSPRAPTMDIKVIVFNVIHADQHYITSDQSLFLYYSWLTGVGPLACRGLFLQPLRLGMGMLSPCSITDYGMVHLFAQHNSLATEALRHSG